MTGLRTVPAVLSCLAALAAASCGEPAAPMVEARDAWCRATAEGAVTAACYLTLTSSTTDRLVAFEADAAAIAEIHEMRMDGDIMRMRRLDDGLPLPAGEAVALRPGAEHLMLVELRPSGLSEGETVALSLVFERAPGVTLTAPVLQEAPQGETGHAGH